ncbi:MAG: hypothetical protein PVH19_10005 [Planctomycetia bacterium]|jgi:hypothetical protein
MGSTILQNLDGWDWALLGAAILIAIYTLTVMMNRYRQRTVDRLRSEAEAESRKAAAAEKAAAKKK